MMAVHPRIQLFSKFFNNWIVAMQRELESGIDHASQIN